MKIDFANLKKQYKLMEKEINDKIKMVLENCRFIMGEEINELEEKLSKFACSKYTFGVSSGTDAILISLLALNVKHGDEIITTPFTFIATAEVISLLGAKPVFVDIDETTYNIDIEKIKSKITSKTKAIIAVSLYGQPCDLDELNNLKNQNPNIKLIIDGAQSFGALYKENPETQYCDIYTTSFFPAKPLGCYGDGGAIFTDNEELALKIKSLRVHGQTKRYYHKYIGVNGRLDTIQAAILLVKLKYFPEEIKLRQQVAERYIKLMKNNKNIVLPTVKNDRTSVWAQFSIRVKNRDEIKEKLLKHGIPTAVHYPMPLHLQECFSYLNYKKGDFPIAEKVSNEILSLPMNPYLTQEEQEYIANTLNKITDDN